MELLDLYDDKGNLLGKTVERGTTFNTGNIMLSIIFIRNSNNKYLIQLTSKERGSIYTSTGGHVTHGETGLTTILREANEELGLKISKDKIKFLDLIKHPTKTCLINVYFLEQDVKLDELKLQKEEVAKVFFLTQEEILTLIKEEKFSLTHGYLFKKYFL